MGAIPGLDAELLERAERADEAGVVEGDIETAEFADRSRDQSLNVGLGRNVGALKDRASAVLASFAYDALTPILVEVGDYHGCPFAGKADSGGAAHPGRRAGDHGNFVIEPAHVGCSYLLISGRWSMRPREEFGIQQDAVCGPAAR